MSLKISDSGTTLSAPSLAEVPALFRKFITQELSDPGELIADGQWRQFQTRGDLVSTKQGRKAGTVLLATDSLTGAFGSRRPAEYPIQSVHFELPESERPTAEQTAAHEQEARQKQATLEQEATDRAVKVWSACAPVSAEDSYMTRHGVNTLAAALPEHIRQHPNGTLLIAMRDKAGRIRNLERIKPDGTKAALSGGRTRGLGLWIPSKPVSGDWYVCEGFAKALAINHATGLPALCCCSASNMSAAIAEHCAGLTDGILAGDNDAAGRAAVSEAMQRYPELRSVFPPDGSGDWNDVLVKQGKDAIVLALKETVGVDWPEPQPLPAGTPTVEPFPLGLLPDSLQPWVADIADRLQCPPDYPAIAAMVALAALVGRRVGIRPKRFDDWTVIPNLWGVIIGRPGLLKSPALHEALKPIHRLEAIAAEAFEAEKLQREALEDVREQQKNVRKARIKELLKEGLSPADIAKTICPEDDSKFTRRRYVVNDSSVEKLGELLNENANGLLAFRDELLGLLTTLDKEGQEGSRQFYLEAWNGNGRFTYDRIGRGTVDIKACCLSILGGIQPGRLS